METLSDFIIDFEAKMAKYARRDSDSESTAATELEINHDHWPFYHQKREAGEKNANT
jgi:hypothetical protein